MVGGYSETFEEVGEAAGDLILQILDGTKASELPARVNPNQRYRVDARALDRWKLSEDRLPAGTIVEFKQPTLWTQYRGYVLGTLLIFGLQSLFVAALLIQRRRRFQAERMLRASEELMQSTAAAIQVALWHVDRLTNTFWASDQTRVMFGIAPMDPVNRETLLKAVHPDDEAIAKDAIEPMGGTNFSVSDDFRVVVGDHIRWIRCRSRLHTDNPDSPDRVSGVFVDVTEQKNAEAETALQRQELAHLTRVSVMGELSGAIAHEINQPLTAILSNAQAAQELLAQKPPNLAEVAEALHDIVQADNRAGEVVNRIRSLLKKGESSFAPTDINEIVTATVVLLRTEMIGRGVRCETDLTQNLPPVFGDAVQIQQVLLNLVMNAMDAMNAMPHAQRIVTIRTRERRGGLIEVLVVDRGPGVAEDIRHKVLQPFYTTKEHGLGLGLSICSSMVDAHGGKLTLGNHRGGAVASFTVPRHQVMIAAQ